jgi:hypothetical protein
MAGTNIELTEDDLRMIIGLCELDHKVTDLIGPRVPFHENVQHRYRVAGLAAKANIILQAHIATKMKEMQLTSDSE